MQLHLSLSCIYVEHEKEQRLSNFDENDGDKLNNMNSMCIKRKKYMK